METQDLSQLAVLPNELLVKVCQEMDDRTLINFASTYGRVYQECKTELEKRQNVALNIKKALEDEVDQMLSNFGNAIEYHKIIGDKIIMVSMVNLGEIIEVAQFFRGLSPGKSSGEMREFQKNTLWPFEIGNFTDNLQQHGRLAQIENTPESRNILIKSLRNIKRQGYTKGRFRKPFYSSFIS